MDSRYGFTRMSVSEFRTWISAATVSRMISVIQEHHTWQPNYASFTGSNHFEMQRSMKAYHVGTNGWADIGQHFSIFPDGMIVTGRPMNRPPACIYGNNARSICIENVGDFDAGRDAMKASHRNAIIEVTAALAKRFNLNPVTTNNVVYHHWFDLNTGARTNGSGSTKSCPGTAFFGGNTVSSCQSNFLPLVQAAMGTPSTVAPLRYGRVTSLDPLNVRTGPSSSASLAPDQAPLVVDSVVRIFDQQGNWLKISNSKQHWVSARYVESVERRTVSRNIAEVRLGPGPEFAAGSALTQGTDVFVGARSGNWGRISVGGEWISMQGVA